jgi:hypothetical protein
MRSLFRIMRSLFRIVRSHFRIVKSHFFIKKCLIILDYSMKKTGWYKLLDTLNDGRLPEHTLSKQPFSRKC